MVTNKDKVLSFVMEYDKECSSIGNELIKFNTEFISEKTNIQRANVSTILNQLVNEGKIKKYLGRPVLYSLSEEFKKNIETDEFGCLIGSDTSLKEVIQYTKAAITYPSHTPRILYIGEKGTEVSELGKCAYDFACHEGILKKNSEYLEIDCSLMDEKAFQSTFITKCEFVSKVNHGMFLIKNMDSISRKVLSGFIDNVLANHNVEIVLLAHIQQEEKIQYFKDFFNFSGILPSLRNRSVEERYKHVEYFFQQEASNLNKRIEVNYGLMQCLLLYPCEDNLSGLKNNIQFGVANAFVKTKKNARKVVLELSDLPAKVRKGMLYLNKMKDSLDQVIVKDNVYIFDKDHTYHASAVDEKLDLYKRIDRKRYLFGKNVQSEDVDTFLFANIEEEINEYLVQLTEGYDEKQLEKDVSLKLRTIVHSFMDDLGNKFNRVYANEIYYGICLHLNKAITSNNNKQRISNEKVIEIMEVYGDQYLCSRKLIQEIESSFGTQLSRDEIVFITLFISLHFKSSTHKNEVVTLIAMHGKNSASSIEKAIKVLMPVKNLESFDLPLDEDIEITYERLKKKIITINKGKGIFVIYDMGSIQVMLNSISQETNIELRFIEMPIGLLAMSSCKYSEAGKSVDQIHDAVIDDFSDTTYSRRGRKDIIITLSTEEDKKSENIRKILETLEDSKDYRILSFDITNKRDLINQLNQIQTLGTIVGIVGTYNPEVFNLRYVNYTNLSSVQSIRELFAEKDSGFDVFEYLTEQFSIFTHADLEITLLPFLTELERILNKKLSEDTRFGFLIHIGCLINRLVNLEGSVVNLNLEKIKMDYPNELQKVKEAMHALEDYYRIQFSLGDAATIVDIFKKEGETQND